MNRNYIIFFWIICLILFTFYCVFRLKYLSDTSYKNKDTNSYKQEKYEDVKINIPRTTPVLTAYTGDVIVTRPAMTTRPITPVVTKIGDFITYIEDIQSKGKLSDMLNCENLYDDNLKVRDLGYKSCELAYVDYLEKNYDINTKYGDSRTLAEICPIASKSTAFQICIQELLTKFTDSVHLINNVNIDMTNSINSRLNVRTDDLYKIQASISPFIYSKVQNDFNNDMLMKQQIANKTDDKLNLINKYYKDKYQSGIEIFTNTNTNEQFTNVILPDIETLFFGKYQPVRGQFQNLADLIFSIEYDDSGNNIKPNIGQPTLYSPLSLLSIKTNTRPVMFTLRNSDIYITYAVYNIDYYKLNKNTIKLILANRNIIYKSSPSNIVEPLLETLGLYSPSSIILVFEPYTTTEKIKHDTYRLVNDNLDTILVLDKLPSPQTTNSSPRFIL